MLGAILVAGSAQHVGEHMQDLRALARQRRTGRETVPDRRKLWKTTGRAMRQSKNGCSLSLSPKGYLNTLHNGQGRDGPEVGRIACTAG